MPLIGTRRALLSPPPFVPTQVANLQLWLPAWKLAGFADGDPVGTWTDWSGNGRNATQATAAKKPTYKTSRINGRPSVLFDAVDDYLDVADTATLALTGNLTLYVVTRLTAVSGNNSFISKDNGAGPAGAYYALILAATSKMTGDRPGVAAGPTATSAVSAGVWYSLRFMVSGTTESYYQNGAANNSGALATGTAGSNPLHIGSFAGTSNPLNGDLAEVILYNQALSTADDARVRAYITRIYGV